MEHVKEDVFPNHCVSAKRLQSCLTLCDPMNYIAHQVPLSMGILQARILEWVAMLSFSRSSPSRIEPKFLTSPALADGFFTTSTSWEVQIIKLLQLAHMYMPNIEQLDY